MVDNLTPQLILGIICAYFTLLFIISWVTGRKASNEDFFLAGRKSPWFLVAFGMIGASLSGVTFISIPGVVGQEGLNQDFSYMQMVFGYLLGYVFIAHVLMPIYYRMNLTSIYTYLDERLGLEAYKTGAAFFLLSRIIGSAFRVYLVAMVLQEFVMVYYGIPFWVTVGLTILLIWSYTFRGGIKTIVYTDTFQTACMLGAVILTIISIGNTMDLDIGEIVQTIYHSENSQIFFWDGGWSDGNYFFKQFISGALITIVMTGLDQDMMQKNLSCRNIKEAQYNMYSFSVILIFANLLFLSLGVLLYQYADTVNLALPETSDKLFPMIALNELSPYVGILFILGLVAAAYSSADSALTALTTSFSVDILNIEKRELSKKKKRSIRKWVHVMISLVLFLLILAFNAWNNEAVITKLFQAATYTYGPLMGLFFFGLMTKHKVKGFWVPIICILSPIICFIIDYNSQEWFNGLKLGYMTLALNGILTFVGLYLIKKHSHEEDNRASVTL